MSIKPSTIHCTYSEIVCKPCMTYKNPVNITAIANAVKQLSPVANKAITIQTSGKMRFNTLTCFVLSLFSSKSSSSSAFAAVESVFTVLASCTEVSAAKAVPPRRLLADTMIARAKDRTFVNALPFLNCISQSSFLSFFALPLCDVPSSLNRRKGQ